MWLRVAEQTTAGAGDVWTPRELRTSFVSLMSHRGVSIEEIARLAGHASTRTTEVVYRRDLRPIITTGGSRAGRGWPRQVSSWPRGTISQAGRAGSPTRRRYC